MSDGCFMQTKVFRAFQKVQFWNANCVVELGDVKRALAVCRFQRACYSCQFSVLTNGIAVKKPELLSFPSVACAWLWSWLNIWTGSSPPFTSSCFVKLSESNVFVRAAFVLSSCVKLAWDVIMGEWCRLLLLQDRSLPISRPWYLFTPPNGRVQTAIYVTRKVHSPHLLWIIPPSREAI